MLFTKKILGKRVVCHAARATIEQLERRRLLTSCPGTDLNGVFEIDGDNSVNNVITVYWDSTNSQLYVKEGTTEVCRDTPGTASKIKVYGGSGPGATSTGADTIAISSDNGYPSTIFGQDGNDTISGGTGQASILGGNGNDYLTGGSGNDYVYGDDGVDTMDGGGGSDSMWGGAGGDSMGGNSGDDWIFGEGDTDQLFGQAGDDHLYGGGASDSLMGNAGNDVLDGGADFDWLYGNDSSSDDFTADTLDGGANDNVQDHYETGLFDTYI